MEILPLLIGISIVAVIAIAGVFVWAVRSGQFDDLDTPAVRILADEDESPPRVNEAPRRDLSSPEPCVDPGGSRSDAGALRHRRDSS